MSAPSVKQDVETKAQTERDAFRHTMRSLAAGVSIVAAGRGEERTGMTATSVTSLSLDPPTLLVCVNQSASVAPVLRRYGHFSVNFLSGSQKTIAEIFAGKEGAKGAARFLTGNWITMLTGAPVLADAIASIDCEVDEILDRHTHAIVIGRVAAIQIGHEPDALVYWRNGFLRISSGALGS